ncbi:unnamed protein product [Lactuca saligna]|uniref:Uncharacterized protein n=1 Tax=Lactuca saligna TaxID=75948 RepID=A0AA36E6X1_LACSI|nr:unnamed protein product [Lactuca saligna]
MNSTTIPWRHVVARGRQPPNGSSEAAIGMEMKREEGGSNPLSTATAPTKRRRFTDLIGSSVINSDGTTTAGGKDRTAGGSSVSPLWSSFPLVIEDFIDGLA